MRLKFVFIKKYSYSEGFTRTVINDPSKWSRGLETSRSNRTACCACPVTLTLPRQSGGHTFYGFVLDHNGIRTNTHRTNTHRTYTPGQIPTGQLPPLPNTHRTITHQFFWFCLRVRVRVRIRVRVRVRVRVKVRVRVRVRIRVRVRGRVRVFPHISSCGGYMSRGYLSGGYLARG